MQSRTITLAVLAVVLIGAVLAWSAGSFLTSVSLRPVVLPSDVQAQAVEMLTAGKGRVSGSFMRGQGRGGLLLLHGIRGSRLDMLVRARFLHRLGYSVLLIDLPGHGASPASTMTFGLREADGVRAALTYLRQQVPHQRIGVIGVSLGAASLVLCEACPKVDAVVLESMYPTIQEAVEDRLRMRVGWLAVPASKLLLWQLPLRLDITPEQLRPIARMRELRAPVLIVSGSEDMHTTSAETKRIFEAAAEPKQLWLVTGATHQNLHDFASSDYERKIAAFFSDNLLGDAAMQTAALPAP